MSPAKKKDASKEADKPAASPPSPTTARRTTAAIVACVLAATALTAADLWSKSWAEGALSHARAGDPPDVCATDERDFILYQRIPADTISIVDDVLELEYAENCGAAFGLLRQAPTIVRRLVFGVAAVAATIVLLWMFVQGRGGPYFAVSVPLVISGAIGNFFDRFLYGYVVDFIHFHYEHPILWMDRFDYPTFNVADIAITIGVILLLIDGVGSRQEEEKPKPAPEEPAPAGAAADDEEEDDEDDEDDDAAKRDEARPSAEDQAPKPDAPTPDNGA
ncbi:MAG: signal peptidase II [Sandaracinus sp.]